MNGHCMLGQICSFFFSFLSRQLFLIADMLTFQWYLSKDFEKKSMGGEMSFRPLVRPHRSFTSLFSHPSDKFQLTMASHLNPPNRQSHVYNSNQLIRDIRHACLTRLLGMKVEIYQIPTLPTSFLRTSSPTSGRWAFGPERLVVVYNHACSKSKFESLHNHALYPPLPPLTHLINLIHETATLTL